MNNAFSTAPEVLNTQDYLLVHLGHTGKLFHCPQVYRLSALQISKSSEVKNRHDANQKEKGEKKEQEKQQKHTTDKCTRTRQKVIRGISWSCFEARMLIVNTYNIVGQTTLSLLHWHSSWSSVCIKNHVKLWSHTAMRLKFQVCSSCHFFPPKHFLSV